MADLSPFSRAYAAAAAADFGNTAQEAPAAHKDPQWHKEMVGKMVDLFTEWAGPRFLHAPESQQFVRVQILSEAADGAGTRAKLFIGVLVEGSTNRPNWSKIVALRVVRDPQAIDLTRYHDRVRATLGSWIHQHNCGHWVGIQAWNICDGDSIEMMDRLEPVSQFLGDLRVRDVTEQREKLIGSFLKSILMSLYELQTFAQGYNEMLLPAYRVQSASSVLVHGDVKVENLLFDPAKLTIRLGDMDTITCIPSGSPPVSVASASTIACAPPEVRQGRINEKADAFMTAVAVLRLFTAIQDFICPRPLKDFALALKLPENCAAVTVLWQLLRYDPAERPSLTDALGRLCDYETDAFAQSLPAIMARQQAPPSAPPTHFANSHSVVAMQRQYVESFSPAVGYPLPNPKQAMFDTCLIKDKIEAITADHRALVEQMSQTLQAAPRESRNQLLFDFLYRTYERPEDRICVGSSILSHSISAIVLTAVQDASAFLNTLANKLNSSWGSSKNLTLTPSAFQEAMKKENIHYFGRIFAAVGQEKIIPSSWSALFGKMQVTENSYSRTALKLMIALGFLNFAV